MKVFMKWNEHANCYTVAAESTYETTATAKNRSLPTPQRKLHNAGAILCESIVPQCMLSKYASVELKKIPCKDSEFSEMSLIGMHSNETKRVADASQGCAWKSIGVSCFRRPCARTASLNPHMTLLLLPQIWQRHAAEGFCLQAWLAS